MKLNKIVVNVTREEGFSCYWFRKQNVRFVLLLASSNEQRLSCFICGKYLLVSCGGTSVLSEIGSATILKQYNEMNMCMALH